MNVIGIDAGSNKSGVAIVANGQIVKGMVIGNQQVMELLTNPIYANYHIVIEDLRAYSVRLSQDLINTAKFIGKMEYVLDSINAKYTLVERVQIKKMVYDKYPSAEMEVKDKIMQRGKINPKTLEYRKPSMIYVCDRVVANAMRYFWDLPKGQGKRNKLGLASHSWQGLALCSYYLFNQE